MNRVIYVILAMAVSIPVLMKSRPAARNNAAAPFIMASSSRSMVRISGDVRRPGIYSLDANNVTGSVIKLAAPFGRFTSNANDRVSLRSLRNGSDIRVIKNSDGAATIAVGAIPTAQRIVLGIPLDMAAMGAQDFEQVPGIGPVLAQRIVEYRQYNGGRLRPEDLPSIVGIGEIKYKQLLKYF